MREERDFIKENKEAKRKAREERIQSRKNITFDRAQQIWEIIYVSKNVFDPQAVILRRENMLDNIQINEIFGQAL